MPNYTIWSIHGEVGDNVSEENNDDVAMPNVDLHEPVNNEETDVNKQLVPTANDVFRNTLADDTEHDDVSVFCRATSEFFRMSRYSRKMMVASVDIP